MQKHKQGKSESLPSNESELLKSLILYNDDINSFDFVIETLMDVCDHDETQAIQCTYIAHYKGKCEIRNGSFESLHPIKQELTNKGLLVTIE
jgi:ATP-dependent Clp protease adaptor protein ClpS